MIGALPPALLHAGVAFRWTSFTVHPSTLIGLAALGALYAWAAIRLPEPPSVPRRVAFGTGLLVILLSLNGPVHDLSDSYLFSAHMLQHLVLTLIAPALLLGGTTASMLRPLLRHRAVRALAERVTKPIPAFAIFNITLLVWHLPVVYDMAMRSHGVHILQHLMFIATSVLMWWPILGTVPELPRLPYPGQMLYAFLMTLPMGMLSIFITYADTLLYPAYAAAPRVVGLSPLEDQRLGGLIMWVPGGLFFLGVMSVVFFRWAAEEGGPSPASAQ